MAWQPINMEPKLKERRGYLTIRLPLAFALSIVFATLIAFSTLAPAAQAGNPTDYDTETGHFFTQTNGKPTGQSGDGFLISDDDGIPFWREYRALGGVKTLGYPISRRYSCDGLICQAIQHAILQWDPGQKTVRLVNSMDYLSVHGRDGILRESRLAPRLLDTSAESGLTAAEITQKRLALLDANPALRAAYRSVPDSIALYGLPTSEVQDVEYAMAIRTQRTVLYQWKASATWATPGQVTVGNAGDFVKEMGLLPSGSVVLESAVPAARAPQPAASRGGQRDASVGLQGVATWYGDDFHGNQMANGEIYNMYNPGTSASNSHPMGTILRVTNLNTDEAIIVRVTDRGAFTYPIIVDLSYAAFAQLASPNVGVIPIRVEVVR